MPGIIPSGVMTTANVADQLERGLRSPESGALRS